MSQLSIYDKLKHYSDKDVTLSIGKHDVIYITFRHNSWKRFTPSEHMTVSVEKNHLKFGSKEGQGITLKLKKSNYKSETAETSRYIQIDGKKYPAILEIAKRAQGSYDLPKQEEKKPDVWDFKPKKPEHVTSSQLAKDFAPDLTVVGGLRSGKRELARRTQFMEDARTLLQSATSTEERTAIFNALAAVYGQAPEPKLSEEDKKWSV